MILAGDVGGTKVHLALYKMVEGRLILGRDFKFPALEFASLEDVVNRFLSPGTEGGASDESERLQITAACFGCPGPVRDVPQVVTPLPVSGPQAAPIHPVGIGTPGDQVPLEAVFRHRRGDRR